MRVMEKCSKCDKESVIKVGKDNVPLCADHFLIFLKGFNKIIRTLVEMFDKYGISL